MLIHLSEPVSACGHIFALNSCVSRVSLSCNGAERSHVSYLCIVALIAKFYTCQKLHVSYVAAISFLCFFWLLLFLLLTWAVTSSLESDCSMDPGFKAITQELTVLQSFQGWWWLVFKETFPIGKIFVYTVSASIFQDLLSINKKERTVLQGKGYQSVFKLRGKAKSNESLDSVTGWKMQWFVSKAAVEMVCVSACERVRGTCVAGVFIVSISLQVILVNIFFNIIILNAFPRNNSLNLNRNIKTHVILQSTEQENTECKEYKKEPKNFRNSTHISPHSVFHR